MRARLLFSALAAAVLIAGCGGDDDDSGGGDAAEILLATLTQDSPDIESANASTEISGTLGGEQGGDFSIAFSGPIEFGAEGEAGALDWTVDASANTPLLGALLGAEELDFEGGVTLADEQLFVTYQDTVYEASGPLSEQLRPTLEGSVGPTATSGLDEDQAQEVVDAFSDLSNEGTEEVAGEETTHLSGRLDAEALANLSGEEGNPVQVEGIDAVDFDIWIAESDNVARRVVVGAEAEIPEEASSFLGIDSVDFELSSEISDLNEAEAIEAPKDAEPIDGLLEELGIDPAQFGAGGTGGGAGGDIGVPGGQASDPATQECIAEAETAEQITACLDQ